MKDCLRVSHRLELRSARIYRALAGASSLGSGTCSLFARLAKEEDHHAERLARELDGPWPESRRLSADRDMPGSIVGSGDEILQLLDRGELTPAEALRRAKGLELLTWDFHLHHATEFYAEDLRNVFIDLARCERNHITLLSEAFLAETESGAEGKAARG